MFTANIFAQILSGRQDVLIQNLEEMRQNGQCVFPGTVARYIVESEIIPGQVEISLVWRSTVMPNEEERELTLEAFRQTLDNVLIWETAHYNTGKVLMHT